MAFDDGYDNRSAFIRRLIRLEIRRRENLQITNSPPIGNEEDRYEK